MALTTHGATGCAMTEQHGNRIATTILNRLSELGYEVRDSGSYANLEAEAQALREERDRIERNRDMWKGQCERQAEKLAALRARVVVPDGYALVPVELTRDMWVAVNKEDDKAFAGACDHGAQFDWLWEAAIEAAPRLNGKAVSEGLLRRFYEANVTSEDFDQLGALLDEGEEVGP